MMKKIYKYFLFALILSFIACENEDFLNRYPLDRITSQNYWKSTSDLELYLNELYREFPGYAQNDVSGGLGIFTGDHKSDNMVPYQYNTTLAGTRTIPSDGGGWTWSKIRTVNIFFENYSKCESPYEQYKKYVGEAMFFKAYFYFDLLKNFGDVPWYSESLETDSDDLLYAPRTARNIVVDSILVLLDNAIEKLDPIASAIPFRLNKEVALLFKSRVALYEGTWEKYHAGTPFGVSNSNPDKYLQQAADAALELMNMGSTEIYSTGNPTKDYINLFNKNDYSGVSEILLWKKFDFSLGMGHSYWLDTYHGRGSGLSKMLVEDYLCNDGLPISLSPQYNGDFDYLTAAENRDPRLPQTLFMPGDVISIKNNVVIETFIKPRFSDSPHSNTSTGYQIEKGHRPEKYTDADFNDSDNASIFFRYAEALLNFAEAKAELGILTQEDIDKSINKLRERVAMPSMILSEINSWNDPNWSFPTLSPVINEIRRERRIELAVEGYRFDDLARWRAHHLITGVKPLGAKFIQEEYPTVVVGKDILVNDEGYIDPYQRVLPNGWGFKPERDYLSPIPSNEITLNDNLVQNPGWD